MALLPQSSSGLVILTARNGALTDAGAPFAAGLVVLAGGQRQPANHAFVITYLVVDLFGVVVVALLAAWILHPRWRRRCVDKAARRGRAWAVVAPAVGHLLLAGALYIAVFWGLGLLTIGTPMSLRFAFGFIGPDVSTLVLIACLAIVARAALLAIPVARADPTRVDQKGGGSSAGL